MYEVIQERIAKHGIRTAVQMEQTDANAGLDDELLLAQYENGTDSQTSQE